MKNLLFILLLMGTINSYSQTKNDTLTDDEKKKIIAQKRYDELKKRSEKAKAMLNKSGTLKNDSTEYKNTDKEIMQRVIARYKAKEDSLASEKNKYLLTNPHIL